MENNNSTSRRPKLEYLHLFRGISILFIVAAHLVWSDGDHPLIKHALRLMISNSTIFFLIISGFLFEYLSINYKAIPFLAKKLKYIALPYLFCSIPILLFLLIRFPEENSIKQLFNYLITGSHLGPFWYIPVILFFFLTSPIIIHIKRFIVFKYALIITLGYSILTSRPDSYNLISNVIYFFGFFHLGIVMAMHRHTIEHWFAQPKTLLFLFVLWAIPYSLQFANILPFDLKTIQLLLLGFLLMNVSYLISHPFIKKVLSLLADYSFGIYFIHQYLINIFAAIAARIGFDYHNLIYSMVVFPIVIICSMVIIYTTKKLVGNKRSRLFIGS